MQVQCRLSLAFFVMLCSPAMADSTPPLGGTGLPVIALAAIGSTVYWLMRRHRE